MSAGFCSFLCWQPAGWVSHNYQASSSFIVFSLLCKGVWEWVWISGGWAWERAWKGRLMVRTKVKQGLFFLPVFPRTPTTTCYNNCILFWASDWGQGRWSMIDLVNSTGEGGGSMDFEHYFVIFLKRKSHQTSLNLFGNNCFLLIKYYGVTMLPWIWCYHRKHILTY